MKRILLTSSAITATLFATAPASFDSGLAYSVDNVDGMDAAIAALYAKGDDGKFTLSVSGLPKQDNSKLTQALDRERENARNAAASLKGWERLGLTADEVKAVIQTAEEDKTKKSKAEGDFDTLMEQAQEKWATERAELIAERDESRTHEHAAVIENQLIGSLVSAGFTEEGVALLPQMLAKRVKIETIDGKRVSTIMTEDGSGPMAGEEGGRATFAELAKTVSVKFPSLVNSQRLGGGGKPPNGDGNGNGKQMLRSEFDKLPSGERTQLISDGVEIVN